MTILHRSARFIAAGLGSGWLPKAPGTWGSLASLLPAWLLLLWTGVDGLLFSSLLLLFAGCYVCAVVLPRIDADDPGWIVIDEWVGQWITIAMVVSVYGISFLTLLIAFLAFRIFDILKPFPIRHVEHLGPPWWSIMADDLLAAVMAGISVIVAGMLAGMSTGAIS